VDARAPLAAEALFRGRDTFSALTASSRKLRVRREALRRPMRQASHLFRCPGSRDPPTSATR